MKDVKLREVLNDAFIGGVCYGLGSNSLSGGFMAAASVAVGSVLGQKTGAKINEKLSNPSL